MISGASLAERQVLIHGCADDHDARHAPPAVDLFREMSNVLRKDATVKHQRMENGFQCVMS
jgi:hypothetical protein